MVTVITNERPAYRILNEKGFYGSDDNMYPEGSMIYWDGEPNEEMEPLNMLARERMTIYVEKLDALAKAAAEKTGRPFVERPRTLEGALIFTTENERSQRALMTARKDTEAAKVEKIEKDEVPETGEKRKRGRPAKTLQPFSKLPLEV